MDYQFFKTEISEPTQLVINGVVTNEIRIIKTHICTHPLVERYWIFGGFSPNAPIDFPYEATNLKMKNGDFFEFVGDKEINSHQKADEYLKNLPMD